MNKKIYVNSPFELYQFSDGKIKINFSLINQAYKCREISALDIDAYEMKKITNVSLKGNVQNPNGIIVAKYLNIELIEHKSGDCYFTLKSYGEIEIKYSDYKWRKYEVRFGLTNFYFDSFYVELKDFNIEFFKNQDYKNIIDQLKKEKGAQLTSEGILFCKKKKSTNLTSEIRDITRLLSYSIRTDIRSIYEQYYYKGNLHKILLIPAYTKDFVYGHYLINPNIPSLCKINDFIEAIHPYYVAQKESFGFNLAFDYYLNSIRSNIIQNMFIFGFICLEVLLDHFEGYQESIEKPLTTGIKKKYKKKIYKILKNHSEELSDDVIDKIAEKCSYLKVPVNTKLSKFGKEFSMRFDKYDQELSVIRNEIIHTGNFPKYIGKGKNKRKIREIDEIYRLIYLNDRIILRLLNYKRKMFHNIFKNYQLDHIDF